MTTLDSFSRQTETGTTKHHFPYETAWLVRIYCFLSQR